MSGYSAIRASAGPNGCPGSPPSRSSSCCPEYLVARRAHPDLHPVRAVARPHPRLRRHHHARPQRVLRPGRLHRRARSARKAGDHRPVRAARRRRRRWRRSSASLTGAVILRTRALTLLMLTLAITVDPARDRQQVDQHDRRRRRAVRGQGGADPRRCSASTSSARPPSSTAWWRSSSAGGWCAGSSTRRSARCSPASARTPTRMHAIGAPVYWRLVADLHHLGDHGRHRRRAAHPDQPVRRPQRARPRALGRRCW